MNRLLPAASGSLPRFLLVVGFLAMQCWAAETGITEVKAVHELRTDGSMVSSSEYFKEGQWVPGHAATYREDPKADVVFR